MNTRRHEHCTQTVNRVIRSVRISWHRLLQNKKQKEGVDETLDDDDDFSDDEINEEAIKEIIEESKDKDDDKDYDKNGKYISLTTNTFRTLLVSVKY